MTYWKDKRVLVTGAYGFLGTHLRAALAPWAGFVFVPYRKHLDLLDLKATAERLAVDRPHVVIHLAANCGGIGYNQANPGTLCYENTMMGFNLIEACRLAKVPKVVVVGTVCAYPKYTPVPFSETELWQGYPEETNAPYGLAKKHLLVLLQAYRKQYGMNGIYLVPANLYGPGDHFEPEKSHVIPALIRKFLANDREVTLWGSGSASREFLYAPDAAEAIMRAAQVYGSPEPMNIGGGREVTISALAGIIARLSGFKGQILWDPSKPDGQPRRALDISRMRAALAWEPKTSLEDGLRKTIDWYQTSGKDHAELQGVRRLP